MTEEIIDSFKEKYYFLSNFYPCRPGSIYLHFAYCGEDNRWWPTVEHAYQASKVCTHSERATIVACASPGQAKRAGAALLLRPDWEQIKLDVMFNLLQQKFKDPQLRDKLLRTGDAHLIEGNTWGDVYWGQVNGKGENHLGRLLETLRWHLRHPEIVGAL